MFRLSLGRLRTPPLAATILLVVIGRVYTARAQDEGVPVVPKDSPLIQTAKQQMIFDELRHERAERREAARGARKRATVRHGRKGAKAGEARDEDVAAGRLVTGARGGRGATPLGVKGTAVVPTNVELNDKTGDGVTAGQAEERSVIVGRFGIGAWNDGQGFNTGGDLQALSYTTNGGTTWIRTPGTLSSPAGNPPHFTGSPAQTWYSDPVVSANEKTGNFWYGGLIVPLSGFNGVGVVGARFPGGIFSWGIPHVVVQYNSSTDLADKEWMAADSSTGNLYVTWTHFTSVDDRISFSRSTNNGLTWSPEVVLNAVAENGFVQGSRVEAGPNGEVYVCWSSIGNNTAADNIFIRRSTDGGLTWGPEHLVTTQYSNFGTGAPGFNRSRGITFPSLAVDRSTGPNRGRLYVAFEDCINWFDDPLGGGGSLSEVENNGFFASANLFTPGQRLRGALTTTADLDYWKFSAIQGKTYVFWADSLGGSMLYSMRLFCSDTTGGGTRLAFSGDLSNPGRQGFIVWTAPGTGTYYLRFAPGTTGGYRVQTGVDSPSPPPERARDLRDAFVTYSDDAVGWSTPTLVNDDPPLYDDFLPEVQVGCDGYPYAMWYDFRDATAKCGGLANIYATRSTNGGATWAANQIITTAQTNFTTAASNVAPNMGDYTGMYGGKVLTMAWGDGRLGDVDVFGVQCTNGPGVTCPNDTTVLANSTWCGWYNLLNPNVLFDDNDQYSITLDRDWPGVPISGSVAVPAAGAAGLAPCIAIPDTAANEDVHLCITVSVNGACTAQCCVTLHVLNPVTATLASLVDAAADVNGVKLTWDVQGLSQVTVYRSQGGAWSRIGTATPDGTRRVTFQDPTVVAGQTYGYRLGIPSAGGEVMAGETFVSVPLTAQFALEGARPNPSVGAMSFAFSLKDNSPATLELVDLVGRRVYTREVGSLGAGFHVVPMDRGRLPVGMYAMRLTEHGQTLTKKVSVIR